jgi:anti-sigma B factor antagonist
MTSKKDGGEMVVQIPKLFSVDEAAQFRKDMAEYIEKDISSFILDFKDCEFIDSTGLGVIVAVYKRCVEKGKTLKLCSLSPNVNKVFRLTRLDKVFKIY